MGGFYDLGLRAPRLACLPGTRVDSRRPAGPLGWLASSCRSHRHTLATLLATASIMGGGEAYAQNAVKSSALDPPTSNEDVAKKLERMEQRISLLEGELK